MSVWVLAEPRAGAYFGPRPGRKYRVLKVVFGTFVTFGAMAGLASLLLDPPGFIVEAAGKPPQPRHEWVEIVKPFQLYAMPSPAFGTEPAQFSARRHSSDGSRIDALTYGTREPGQGNWLRIEISRSPNAGQAQIPLYVELARQASRAGGSIARSGLPVQIATRFGPAETASVQVAHGERYTACIGFRIGRQAPGVELAGIACGTPARPINQQTLACTLDRLDLLSSGEDKALGHFFAERELQRGRDCPAARTAQTLDRPGWLNPAADELPLKGSLTVADSSPARAGRAKAR